MIEDIKTTVFLIAALGQTLFVGLYMTFPWYRTFLGRALFFKAFTLGILVNMATAGLVWDWPNEESWKISMYGLVTCGIWVQLIAFIRQKRQAKDEPEGEPK